jgi:hypothetical protein
MLGGKSSRLDPPDILRVVNHVLNCSMSLVHPCRIPRQNVAFDYNAVGIRSLHRANRNQVSRNKLIWLNRRAMAKNKHQAIACKSQGQTHLQQKKLHLGVGIVQTCACRYRDCSD